MVTTPYEAEKKTAKHSRKKMSKKARIILIIVSILVAGGVSYGVWLYLNGGMAKKEVPIEERPLTEQEKRQNNLVDSVVTGDRKKSDAALNEALAAAANDEERANLYLDRASYLYYADNVSNETKRQALSDAEKSYELHASGAAAKTILDIAKDLNQQELINKYQPIFDTYMKDVEDLNKEAKEEQ